MIFAVTLFFPLSLSFSLTIGYCDVDKTTMRALIIGLIFDFRKRFFFFLDSSRGEILLIINDEYLIRVLEE